MSQIKHCIFDLGHVVINYDNTLRDKYLANITGNTSTEVAEIIMASNHWEEHERGKLTEQEYLDYFNSQAKQPVSYQEFMTALCGIFLDMRRNVPEILRELKARDYNLYALTNTCAPHVPIWKEKFIEAVSQFDHLFISNEMGMRKPDAEIYLKVIEKIGDAPESMIFFDDRIENVEAAEAQGMQAYLIETEDCLARILKDKEILPQIEV